MEIEGGYFEAKDQDLDVKQSKAMSGMNYPCPIPSCVLTFSAENDLNHNLNEENPIRGKEFDFDGASVQDKVKRSWVKQLSGQVETRKLGICNNIVYGLFRPYDFQLSDKK
jgi:hypothetical protein